jgi:uncharacterized protein YqgQ
LRIRFVIGYTLNGKRAQYYVIIFKLFTGDRQKGHLLLRFKGNKEEMKGRWHISMKTIYDIQQYLKQFGTIIYIGDRIADLELMEVELKELYQSQLIEPREYQSALLLLRHEIQMEKDKRQVK